jgi:DNA-binding LacI/PurR family transcriptional regulator
MSLDEPPTALYSASDVFTVGLYREARALGLKLPDDLSVISFDDNEISRYLHPALTTFQQDRSAIGTEAAALLLRKIAGQPTTNRVRIPVKLIERESCRTL